MLIFLKLKDYELKRNDDENIVKKYFEFDEEYQGDEILNWERIGSRLLFLIFIHLVNILIDTMEKTIGILCEIRNYVIKSLQQSINVEVDE